MRHTLSVFWKNYRGTVAVIFGLSAAVVCSIGGLAVDVSSWQTTQRSMQGAADMAALSGEIANDLSNGDVVTTEAKGVTASMGYVNGTSNVTVTVNQPPSAGNYTGNPNAIEVIISQPQPQFLSRLFMASNPTVSARSVATPGPGNACLIALDTGNPPNVGGIVGAGVGGLNVSGGGTMSLTKCDIFVNATNSASIDVTGGGTLKADYITADGGTSGTITANDQLITNNANPTPDPYASTRSIPTWSTSGCDATTKPSGSVSNPTGLKVYCQGITISSTVTFASGVYIIANGGITANATINGTGVTFIISSKTLTTDLTGVFNMQSGTIINVSAPTTGTTAGIAFWADGALPHEADNFKAGSVSNITGVVYLPSHLVNYSGSALANTTCFQLVADEISISGGANFTHTNCTGVSVISPPEDGKVQLVE